MDRDSIGHHISRQFNVELEEIRNRVLTMGGLVEQQLTNALKALSDGDRALAENVIAADYRINAMEVQIDEDCVQILARRQPTASDLRLIIAVIKTITDLERIGDEAERIGRMAIHLIDSAKHQNFITSLDYLGQHVRKMVQDALDSFARTDVETAVKAWREDPKVDKEYEGIIRQLMTHMMEDPRSIPLILDMIWIARSLERIGDRSSNICEYVIYLVKGKDVRHINPEHMESTVLGTKI